MMKNHDILIEKLSRSARPVKRPLPTNWRVTVWLAMALPCAIAASLLVHRTLTDWSQTGAIWAAVQSLLSLLLGILALRSTFSLSIAGRRATSWRVFLPLIALWLAINLINIPAGPLSADRAEGIGCYLFMLIVGAPMVAVMIATLRRTPSLYPLRSLAMAGFGVSWIAITLLAFCHPVHFHLHDFAMHLAAGGTIVLLTMLAGKRWVALQTLAGEHP